MWKPPNDGGIRGYYSFNERGDFDPRRRNRKNSNRGFSWSWSFIKDAIFPQQFRLSSLCSMTLQNSLVYINVFFFLYQIIASVLSTPQFNRALSHSEYSGHPFSPLQILQKNLMGDNSIIVQGPFNPKLANMASHSSIIRPIIASSSGPFTMDFIFS